MYPLLKSDTTINYLLLLNNLQMSRGNGKIRFQILRVAILIQPLVTVVREATGVTNTCILNTSRAECFQEDEYR